MSVHSLWTKATGQANYSKAEWMELADQFETMAALIKQIGAGKPTGVPRSEQRKCWCFGWSSMPCINQSQCVKARDILARIYGPEWEQETPPAGGVNPGR